MLAGAFKRSKSLVSVDLSSNELTAEGGATLMNSLAYNESI